MAEDKERPYVVCACGSTDFNVVGLYRYLQHYDARTDESSLSEVQYENDYPKYVECARCQKRMDKEFLERDILWAYYRIVERE